MRIARWLALTVMAAALFSVAGPAHASAPSNDNASNATVIGSLPYSITESTVGATNDVDVDPSSCGMQNSVWFKYTAPAAGHVVVQTRGSSFDTVLTLRWDNATGSGYCVDDGARQRSVLTFDSEAGRTYFIEVGGFLGQTGNLVFNVNSGGSLTGVVRHGQSNQPYANACVTVVSPSGARFTASAASDGTYRVDGLPSGEYQSVTCSFGQGRARPWSAPVLVAEGHTSAAPDVLLDMAALTGVVKDRASGAPLQGACVNVTSTTSDPIFSSTSTSVTGYYSVQAAPGSYSVRFSGCSNGGYADVYFNDAFLAANQTVVNLSGGVTSNGIDAHLARSANIVGSIKEAGTGSNILASCVTAYDNATNASLATVYASSTGFYHLAVPPTGVVVKGAECNTAPGTHVPVWYSNSLDRGGATVLPLTANATVTANVSLPKGDTIYGVLEDNGNSSTLDTYGCVQLDGPDGVSPPVYVDHYNANFAIPGLRDGDYRIRACGTQGRAAEWYNDAVDRASAQVIHLAAPTSYTAVFTMHPEGWASGSVVDDATGKPVPSLPCLRADDSDGFSSPASGQGQVTFGGLTTRHYVVRLGCAGSPSTDLISFDAVRGQQLDFGTIRIPSKDTDADGVADSLDNCPLTPNANQADVNNDDLGNVCDVLNPGTTTTKPPRLSVADKSAAEGNKSHTIPVKIKLSAASSGNVTVVVKTADGTAHAGSDYAAFNQTVTIPAGSTVVTVPITVYGDHTVEPNETFTVTLSSPTGAVISRATATITLTNDD